MVTLSDVAHRLGISSSTVSKALNGAYDVSDELRSQILTTAVSMGYLSPRMRKKDSHKLAVLIENTEYTSPDSFGYDLVLGFQHMAMQNGWHSDVLPFSPSLQTLDPYDTFMKHRGYSGAFLIGFALHEEWMLGIDQIQTPAVLFDNYAQNNPHVSYVGTDNYEGIHKCVSLLVSSGHRRIAFLNGSANCFVSAQRAEAFRRSMAEFQLPVLPELTGSGYFIPETASWFVSGFLQNKATAIVCSSDLLAQGAISECLLLGFHVPEDISITGFDDIPVAREMIPPLTTVRQDRLITGECAFHTLISLINRIPISKTILRATLMERSTVAPIRSAFLYP